MGCRSVSTLLLSWIAHWASAFKELTTVIPAVSMSVSHSTTSAGTPRRDQAIFCMFLLTVSKAFDMSYDVLFEIPCSILAVSSMLMKRSEADMVPLPGA